MSRYRNRFRGLSEHWYSHRSSAYHRTSLIKRLRCRLLGCLTPLCLSQTVDSIRHREFRGLFLYPVVVLVHKRFDPIFRSSRYYPMSIRPSSHGNNRMRSFLCFMKCPRTPHLFNTDANIPFQNII